MSNFSFAYFSWGWTKLSRLDLSIMTPLFVDEIYWACLKGPVKMEEPAHNGTYRVLQIKWLQCPTDHFFRNKMILKVILAWKHILASLLRVRNEFFSFTKHPVGLWRDIHTEESIGFPRDWDTSGTLMLNNEFPA